MNFEPNATERIYNLRKELARQIWLSRKGVIDIFETNENTRELVALCPENYMEAADRLQHKIMSQISVIYGKSKLAKEGLDCSGLHTPVVHSRKIAWLGKIESNMIG